MPQTPIPNHNPQLTTLNPLSLPTLNHSTSSILLPLPILPLCSSQTATSNFLTTAVFCPIPCPSYAFSNSIALALAAGFVVATPAMNIGKTTSRLSSSFAAWMLMARVRMWETRVAVSDW